MSFTDVFGGGVISPSQTGYTLLAISANIIMQWPVEQQIAGGNVAAPIIDINASVGGLSITCPDATLVSPGSTITWNNIGANAVTIKDNAGNTLLSISPGQAWVTYVASNATIAGIWRIFQLGAGTSTVNAASLIGYGIQAIGSTLNQNMSITPQAINYTVLASDQARLLVWTGGSGVFTLPNPATVGSSWFVVVKNLGSGTLTLSPAVGNIDSAGTKVLNALDSTFVGCDGSQYFTVGFGRSVASSFNFISINVGGSTNYTLTGGQLNQVAYRFTGALTGNVQIIVPASIQQYWMDNETTGAFTLSIGTAGQVAPAPPLITQGNRNIFYCDGSNVYAAVTGTVVYPVTAVNGGTGLTTVASGSMLYASALNTISQLTNIINPGTLEWTIPTQLYIGGSAIPVHDETNGIVGYYKRTLTENAAGVTPTNFAYPPGDIRRYGAVTAINCDSIVTTAASCNQRVRFPYAGSASWVITAFPTIPNGVTLSVEPGATFSGAGAASLGFYTSSAGFYGAFYERFKMAGISTTSGSGGTGPYILNVTSDSVDTTTSSNGNLRLLNLIYGISAGHTGGRSGIYSLVNIVGTPGLSPAGQPGYVAFEGLTQCNVNLTGTSGAYANYQGGIYGANPWARTVNGATFLHNVTSQEIDVSVGYGSSTARKNALTINKTVADYLKGDYEDMAVVFADQGGLTNAAAAVPATSFIAGRAVKIQTVGTTDFTLIGSPNNTVGTIFTCTGPGTGTGTGVPDVPPWSFGISFGSYADGQWPFDANSTIIVGTARTLGTPGAVSVVSIEQSRAYKIAVLGSTSAAQWHSLGVPAAVTPIVGTIFIAARAGTTADGTGTVTRGYPTANIGIDWTSVLFATAAFASPGFSVDPAGSVVATSFMPTSSAPPSLGMYGITNLNFATNGTLRLQIVTAGGIVVSAPDSGVALTVNGAAYTPTMAVAFSTTPTIDASARNAFEIGVLTAPITSLTISNPSPGQTISIRAKQDGTGGRGVSGGTLASAKIAGSVATAANTASILTLTYSLADSRWEGSWLQLPT